MQVRNHPTMKLNSHEHTLTISYLLFLIATILSHPKSIIGTSNYLSHDCQNSTTLSPNTSYQSNLKDLLASLYSASARGNDFYYATAGRKLPDVVFGIFLCRADASTCRQCVANASEEVARRCPAEKEAVIWYDQCLLRYSDQPIFAIPSLTPAKFLPGGQRDTGPAVSGKQSDDQFELLLDSMVTAMVAKAANSGLSRKFAAVEQNLTDSETVYGLAQCTPDLTAGDCSKCFMSAKDAIRSCCGGQRSARLLLPSCYVMYDEKLFFNATLLDTRLPPPRPPG